jgi:hypothetical protein
MGYIASSWFNNHRFTSELATQTNDLGFTDGQYWPHQTMDMRAKIRIVDIVMSMNLFLLDNKGSLIPPLF